MKIVFLFILLVIVLMAIYFPKLIAAIAIFVFVMAVIDIAKQGFYKPYDDDLNNIA